MTPTRPSKHRLNEDKAARSGAAAAVFGPGIAQVGILLQRATQHALSAILKLRESHHLGTSSGFIEGRWMRYSDRTAGVFPGKIFVPPFVLK